MATTDDACWVLRGEAFVGLSRRPRRLFPLPTGLQRAPGPALIVAESFDESPVGPYKCIRIGEPARLGARPGFYFGLAVLDSQEARRVGRQYWGYPYELGHIGWSNAGAMRRCTWDERGIELMAPLTKMRLPLIGTVKGVQRRLDGPVVVPSFVRAVARPTRLEIACNADDPLAVIAGEHRGLVLDGLAVRRNPARRAQGVFSTLRAPLRAPEPGILGLD